MDRVTLFFGGLLISSNFLPRRLRLAGRSIDRGNLFGRGRIRIRAESANRESCEGNCKWHVSAITCVFVGEISHLKIKRNTGPAMCVCVCVCVCIRYYHVMDRIYIGQTTMRVRVATRSSGMMRVELSRVVMESDATLHAPERRKNTRET